MLLRMLPSALAAGRGVRMHVQLAHELLTLLSSADLGQGLHGDGHELPTLAALERATEHAAEATHADQRHLMDGETVRVDGQWLVVVKHFLVRVQARVHDDCCGDILEDGHGLGSQWRQ